VTFESDFETDEPDWEPRRPATYPIFVVPARIAAAAALALVATAVVTLIGALIAAVSYREPTPGGLLGQDTVPFVQPSFSFADRVALFSKAGASLTVALVLLVAVVVIAMAGPEGSADRGPAWSWRPALVVAAVIALIIVVANIVMSVEVLSNSSGVFTARASANKASSIFGFLAPMIISAAALLYATGRLRSWTSDEESELISNE
jgi:hypothetical protein